MSTTTLPQIVFQPEWKPAHEPFSWWWLHDEFEGGGEGR
jgi:hypothetical protein